MQDPTLCPDTAIAYAGWLRTRPRLKCGFGVDREGLVGVLNADGDDSAADGIPV